MVNAHSRISEFSTTRGEKISVANLKKYGQMCREDLTVRQRAKEIGLANLDGQIAYGKELGLEFNENDVQAFADEAGISKDELSEEQLEQIAGGCATLTIAVGGAVLGVGMAALLGASAGLAMSKEW
jgi:predicted ribosomally synthesized peptide with nif11-like leader